MAAATVAEIEEPEGPPARREPKLSATVSPSGSVAPSNLRLRHAEPDPAGSPCGAPDGSVALTDLAACPATGPLPDPPLRVRPRPGPPFRPCGLSDRLAVALRPSRVWSPISALRLLRCPVRFLAPSASTAWSEAKCIGRIHRGQPDVPAGQGIYPQVTALLIRVTNRGTGRVREGSRRSRRVSGGLEILAGDAHHDPVDPTPVLP